MALEEFITNYYQHLILGSGYNEWILLTVIWIWAFSIIRFNEKRLNLKIKSIRAQRDYFFNKYVTLRYLSTVSSDECN